MNPKNYIKYFKPLIAEFLDEIKNLNHPKTKRMPEPFFPVYGSGYAKSALRLAIIGQDTRSWGDLREFMKKNTENPELHLKGNLNYFSTHPFTEWGPNHQSFWGFAMMLLASLHGKKDWQAMKRGEMSEILNSFAWGNTNALELYSSTPQKLAVPREYWDKIREAGHRFNRFKHIMETINPNVAIVMNRSVNFPDYLEGYDYVLKSKDERIIHYYLPEKNVDILHIPHPGSMNRIEGIEYFGEKLKEIFQRNNFSTIFPEFINTNVDGAQAMLYLKKNAPAISPENNKFEFVAWVADELKKRDTFMSIPALIRLVNERGYTTDRGNSFADSGRGPFSLVSATYHRMKNNGHPDRAHNVAVAFRKADFSYAYEAE